MLSSSIPSLLWLIVGGILRLFDFGRWTILIAPWLALLFLLHFVRLQTSPASVLWVALVLLISAAVALRGVIPVPRSVYLAVIAVIAGTYTIPFISDYLVASKLPGFVSTLIFPLSWVTIEVISARLNPFSTWGSIAYTQYGNLPLMQLSSVTGIWGITFLITWFASVVNWAWDNQFDWEKLNTGLLIYMLTWGIVILGGGARLAFRSSRKKSVPVAVVGWPEGIMGGEEMMSFFKPQLSDIEKNRLRQGFCRVQDKFLEDTSKAASFGAKIVIWPEANATVFKEDETAFLQRTRELAAQEKIYLLVGMATLHYGNARPIENKAVLVGPSGEVKYVYLKTTAVPGLEANTGMRGDGILPTDDTPYGRISSAICYDMDFPRLIRKVGRARCDILLVPASDWADIKQLHLAMAIFRAVENGVTMVRATRWGLSAAVDSYGDTLAIADHLMMSERIVMMHVPVRAGVATLYALIGDLFAWLCVAALLAAVMWGLLATKIG